MLPYPPRLLPTRLDFSAYKHILELEIFPTAVWNSVVNTCVTVVLSVFISTLSAYGFARIRFPGRDKLFGIYLFTLMMPGFLNIIPQFLILKGIQLPGLTNGLIGTRAGLILVYVATNVCGHTFFLRNFFRSLPDSLSESVIIDGGGHGTIFFKIMLPLSKPAIGTMTIFAFQGFWEEYFTAKVLVGADEKMMTLPLLLQRLNGQYATRWEWVFAASILALIPVVALFILFQRKMVVGGLTQGGGKGMKLTCEFDRAQYLTGQEDTAVLAGGSERAARVCVYRLETPVDCSVRQTGRTLILPPLPIGSYGVAVEAGSAQWEGAFDVVEDSRQVTRYAFLSDFTSADTETQDVDWLRQLHFNAVQFYDWMYRHDMLLPPQERYLDPMGRETDLAAIRAKIAACKAAGIRPIAYGAVYAAAKELFAAHPEWAMYTMDGQAMTFAGWLYYMNIAPSCGWSGHILAEFRKAVAFGFPGSIWTPTAFQSRSGTRAASGRADRRASEADRPGGGGSSEGRLCRRRDF